jgi:AcrR family transcriptional regulator
LANPTKAKDRHVRRQKPTKQPRRVGAETSKTRAVLLDSTEQLMLDEGYAAVTYRRVATAAGVTAPLVQYYFPTLDDLFVTLLRRRSEHNLEKLTEALELHLDAPSRVIWEYSTDETTAALLMEFMALAEIAEVSERLRKVQLAALTATLEKRQIAGEDIPASAVLFLLHGIPKLILMESFLGLSVGHGETLEIVDRYLEWAEPSATKGNSRPTGGRSSVMRKARPAAQRGSARATPSVRAKDPAQATRKPVKRSAKA